MVSSKMARGLFDNLMVSLAINYRQKVDKKLTDLFWEEFKNVSEDSFRHAVKDVMEVEEFFPNIAKIKKYLTNAQASNDLPEWPTLNDFSKKVKSPISKDCLRLILAKMNDRIDKQDFYEGMLKLAAKYPNIGFKAQAVMFINNKRDRLYIDGGSKCQMKQEQVI